VFLEQSDVDMSRFGMDSATTELSSTRLEIDKEGKMALGPLAPYGFETLLETELYNSDSLYEKINGKAPLYTDSGFEKLFTQRFVSSSNENLWMELYIYDMAAAKNAFSVYSVQARAEAQILPDMQFGYRTSNALYFIQGKYYVELVGSTESAELDKAMVEIATEFANEIAVDDTEIVELALFPKENLVPASFKLYLANAFGFEGLTDTFAARYQIRDETITVFLSKRADSKEAQATAESYRSFLIENGAVAKTAANEILKGKVLDFYDTTEIVLATGTFLAGVHEAENQQSAEELAVMLINKLKKTTGHSERSAAE